MKRHSYDWTRAAPGRCLAAAFVLPLLAAAAGAPVEILKRPADGRGGRALTEVVRSMKFPQATLTSTCRVDGGAFVDGGGLGLEFGRLPGTNGGWSLWSFFQARLRSGLTLPLTSEPAVFQACVSDGAVIGDLVWEVPGRAGETQAVALRVIQEPQDPGWLYLRIDAAVTGRLDSLSFSAFPGNPRSAVFPKEGERWIATRDQRHCLSRAPFNAPAGTDAMVWHNVYAYENTGCILVFAPEDFGAVTVTGDYGVTAKLLPAPCRTTFDVAIGQYTAEASASFLPRFFGEQVDAVRERLKNIEWNPRPTPERFARQSVLTVKLLSGLGVSGDAFRRDFEALQAAYRQAEASSDSRGALSAANKLDELNSRIADFGLKELK